MTTSTEFLEWLVLIEEEEWQDRQKWEYYLAQIAAEIKKIRESFRKDPKAVSTEEFLIHFGVDESTRLPSDSHDLTRRGGVEIGPSALDDPKWAAVNTRAKSVWFSRMGMKTPNGE